MALWRLKPLQSAGFNNYVAIAEEAKGLAIVFGRLTRGNPTRKLVSGMMNDDQWHGAIASSHCSWWKPPRNGDELVKMNGSVEYAECGVIFECADGSRRPVITTWFWDPGPGRWMLDYLNTNNEPSEHLAAIDF